MQNTIWKDIQNGDAEAMKILYRECYQDLYAYAFRILSDKEKIKDCLHEIFCELWENRNKVGDIEYIKAYLRTCVRNRIFKEIKDSSRTENIENINEGLQYSVLSYEQLLIESQFLENRRLKIWDAVNKLTPTQREIISLKFYENLSYQAISIQLKLKPRTVYNHVYGAICSLKGALKNK
ncbi:RNA polymerase sigma factor [Pedobacter mendelii]|uniref:RNA polymerase n=1 Tax=Pedobacter mendelii TaxID=1908240 RepID=A0ABQ2BGK2_9SPHI|nr:sigma-70 family RNA polymerase sigma factor [Pedobacter mendelii]GGI23377.1 RNA polymerase [Pedobacter mendelii]